jgi:tRNA nucleotidyltransferase/poly(A) polymerase
MSVSLIQEFNNLLSEEYKEAINAAAGIARLHNIKIYLIGGIVRDLIMQNAIKDIDITVETNAIDFCKILEKEADFKLLAIQDNLKTAKMIYKNGTEIDFASTREEKYDKSGNLPVAYNFGCNLKDDVKRRDFTINTLAVSLSEQDKYTLTDYYDGYNDIINRQIRILHENSFIDDPSRIIRALKFKQRFDFDIENNTFSLMHKYLKNVNNTMPLERIKGELKQYFSIDNDSLYNYIIETEAYKLISDNAILNFNTDYYNEIISYNLFNNENKWLIFFILLIFKSDFATERLNLNSEEKAAISDLKELYYSKIKNDNYDIYKAFNKKSNMAIAAYYIITGSIYVKKFLSELKDIKVVINGDDLIKLGLKPSPLFNEIFDKILKEKLDGKLSSKEEEINFVKNLTVNF